MGLEIIKKKDRAFRKPEEREHQAYLSSVLHYVHGHFVFLVTENNTTFPSFPSLEADLRKVARLYQERCVSIIEPVLENRSVK